MPDDSLDVLLEHRGAALLLDAVAAGRHAGRMEPRRVDVSFDLNLSTSRVDVDNESFYFEGHRFEINGIREISRAARLIFRALAPDPGAPVSCWEPVRIYRERYYQLVPTPEAPTVEIDGIQMHRTSGVRPFEAAGAFAAAVVRPGARVLDTCGGLGYTAIQALRLGAAEVRSFEASEGVLCLREVNPWSRLEAGDDRLHLEAQDVLRATLDFDAGSFDAIIHDPPRHALAPDLYTSSFYLRLRDLLSARGGLFHYTGDPNSRRRGSSIVRRVIERLRAAGFRATPRPELQGIVAVAERGRPRDSRTWL